MLELSQSVSLEGIESAHAQLPSEIIDTPIIKSMGLSRLLNCEVWIKAECIGPIASFKARGSLTAVQRALLSGSLSGAVTSSTGNHGQGVAYAARRCGVGAHIFLANNATQVKREMIEALGAKIYSFDGDIDATKDEAKKFADEHQYLFVDDGESRDVIEGAGTVGLEIARALEGVDEIFVPMGSGSLASGAGLAAKSSQPSIRVVAVQASGSPAMALSFERRAPVEHDVDTVAEGLACRVPADLALSCVLKWVDESIIVSEEIILPAMVSMAESAHLLVEPSSAAAFAAAWQVRERISGKRVVLVATGGNATPEVIRRAFAGPGLR